MGFGFFHVSLEISVAYCYIKEDEMIKISEEVLFTQAKLQKEKEEQMIQEEIEHQKESSFQNAETAFALVSAYGPDCIGCSGITAYGYSVLDHQTYFDDDFGEVYIVAADPSLPFGTILELNMDDRIYSVIVLDRGGAIGFSQRIQFDFLVSSEEASNLFGIKEATYVVLRYGF